MKLEIQPSETTCGHAVLAMIIGDSVDDVVRRMGHDPMGEEELLYKLRNYKIPYIKSKEDSLSVEGYYILTVASLNLIGAFHFILIEWKGHDEPPKIYDPSRGKIYDRDAPILSWTNPIYVQPKNP